MTSNSNVTTSVSNLSMISTIIPYTRPFSDEAIIICAVIIFFFLVFGFVGNVLTIAVIGSNARLRNIFMYFILSLCVSDLISALISWLFLYRRTWGFDSWLPLPDFLCKFYWAADVMTNFVTALHILSFATLRYISIRFPVKFSKIKFWHGKAWIAVIWTLCFLCGFIPVAIMFGSKTRNRQSNEPDARFPSCTINMVEEYKVYQKICFPLFLYMPIIGVTVLCLVIALIVRRRSSLTPGSTQQQAGQKKKRKKERQAVLQLALIVLSFLVGYIPFSVYEFWSIEDHPNTDFNHRLDYWFGMSEYLCLRFSECLNPVFYNLGSAKMRKCTKRFLVKRLRLTCFASESVPGQATTSTAATTQNGQFGV